MDTDSFSIIENHILLLYKRCIYECRLNKRSINFLGFKNLISIIRQIEEKISGKKNTMAKTFPKMGNDIGSVIMTVESRRKLPDRVKMHLRRDGEGGLELRRGKGKIVRPH